MRARFHSFLRYLVLPVGLFAAYFAFCLFLSAVIDGSVVLPMIIGDGVGAVCMGLCYYYFCVKPIPREDRKLFRFNGVAVFFLFCLFLAQYVFGQAVSSWVGIHFPSEYIQSYRSMSDMDLMLYLLLSVTLAPVMEELLFRGMWYKLLRERFSVMFSFFVSAFAFGLTHGTTEHMPMTFALSLLICFVFEITGNMFYCIFIHMLANLVSIAYIIQIPVSYEFCIVGFCVYCAVMFLLFAMVGVLREHMRKHPEKPSFTDRLEEKRKHWGDFDE